jgi:basic amino acid/polyamine antiporter, APA family
MRTELKRELGLLDATMINLGTIVASAIFLVPSFIAQQLHASSLVILAWLVGGAVSLLGALSVAELGAAFPEAGGLFVFLREAYGPVWGFLYGWANAVVINPASIAAIAVGFATYVGHFVPLDHRGIIAVAIASIVALTALNCLGVRLGATTQNILTFLKVALVGVLIVAGLFLPGGSAENFRPLWPDQPLGSLVAPFGVAMVAVLWAYDGWIESTYIGSEIKDPGRVTPRAIVLATLGAIVLYSLVSLAYIHVLSPARTALSTEVAADAARVTLGAAGAALVAAAILISTLGANNGIVLTAARIPYAMAQDGVMFRAIGWVHPRWRTPVTSLLVQAAIAIALALSGDYEKLAGYVIFASFLFYALGCGAVVRLRHTRPDLPRPYRAWGYPVTPIVFIAFAAWLTVNTIVEAPRDAMVGAGLIAAGLPFYLFWRRLPPGAASEQV